MMMVRSLSSVQARVDFIICGTQKAGTTALDSYLREIPEICMADKKEVHYFDDETFFVDGQPDYLDYQAWFSPKKSQRLLGEATPIYIYWHDAPRRIWEYNPQMKLIVLLRNPIERAYSHWNMERLRNSESLSFWDAIQQEQERCREALPFQHRVYSYIDRGFYLQQLRRLWMYFPKSRVLVIKNEQLKYRVHETIQQVCEFLNINQDTRIKVRDIHSHPYESRMSPREISWLRSIYEYEIKGLERALGWDCSDWLSYPEIAENPGLD